jgi:hypothetical protein
MPFRSEAQKRFLEKNLPEIAKRFVADTKDTAPPIPDRAPPRARVKPAGSRLQAIAASLVNRPR